MKHEEEMSEDERRYFYYNSGTIEQESDEAVEKCFVFITLCVFSILFGTVGAIVLAILTAFMGWLG